MRRKHAGKQPKPLSKERKKTGKKQKTVLQNYSVRISTNIVTITNTRRIKLFGRNCLAGIMAGKKTAVCVFPSSKKNQKPRPLYSVNQITSPFGSRRILQIYDYSKRKKYSVTGHKTTALTKALTRIWRSFEEELLEK